MHPFQTRRADSQSGSSVRSARGQHIKDETDRDSVGIACRFQTVRDRDRRFARDAESEPLLETYPECFVSRAIPFDAPRRGNPPQQRERIRSRVRQAESASEQRLPDRTGIEVTTWYGREIFTSKLQQQIRNPALSRDTRIDAMCPEPSHGRFPGISAIEPPPGESRHHVMP